MAIFLYTALGKQDAFVRGKVEARNEKHAVAKLEGEGFLVVNVRRETPNVLASVTIFERVSTLDLIFFTRNLFTMLEAGIALDQAVRVTSEQTANKKFRAVLLDIHKRIQSGQPFYLALGEHTRYFSPFYISMVRVGELSGKLDEVLSYLLEQQERDNDLRTKARGAMIYPSIIVTALVLMVTFMMIFVIPKISGILGQYDVQLPLATRILIGLSSFLTHYGYYLIPVIIVLAIAFQRWKKTKVGKRQWDAFLMRLPRIGALVKEFNVARFMRSLSALLKSGISIDQALDLAACVSTNSFYQEAAKKSIQVVRRGIPLGEALKGYPKLYSPMASRMVEVGERAGKLDTMVGRVAQYYEKSVSTSLENLSSVIEPVLLLSIGLIVGFVAIAVLTPIWRFSETI